MKLFQNFLKTLDQPNLIDTNVYSKNRLKNRICRKSYLLYQELYFDNSFFSSRKSLTIYKFFLNL